MYYVYDLLFDGIVTKGLNVQSTLPKLIQLITPKDQQPDKEGTRLYKEREC